MSPRDADHSDLKLAPDGARVTIASRFSLSYAFSLCQG